MKTFINRKSIKWKLLSRWILTLIMLLIIMGGTQAFFMKRYLVQSRYQTLEARFNLLNQSHYQNKESLKTIGDIINFVQDRNTNVAIIDENCGIVGESQDEEGLNTTPKLTKKQYQEALNAGNVKQKFIVMEDKKDNEYMVALRKLMLPNDKIGLLQISTSLNSVNSMLISENLIFIAIALAVILIGIFICNAVIKHVLGPLYQVTHTIKELSVDGLNLRLDESTGQMEIDSLSHAFNGMLGRIETSFEKEQYINEKMKKFVSDASHEIRTPLTSIHGFAEVLLRGAAKNEKQLDLALNSILLESERLTELINELLVLTKLDQKMKLESHRENLKIIIEEVIPQLNVLAGKRNLSFELKDDLYSMLNKNQIKQVILNLVQNAIQHTDENIGEIKVSLNRVDESFLELIIRDNGTGIAKEDLSEIFNRFFRSESHRSRKHGGYGLGLSIVKAIVEAHQGKIEVTSNVGYGTSFKVYFKLVD